MQVDQRMVPSRDRLSVVCCRPGASLAVAALLPKAMHSCTRRTHANAMPCSTCTRSTAGVGPQACMQAACHPNALGWLQSGPCGPGPASTDTHKTVMTTSKGAKRGCVRCRPVALAHSPQHTAGDCESPICQAPHGRKHALRQMHQHCTQIKPCLTVLPRSTDSALQSVSSSHVLPAGLAWQESSGHGRRAAARVTQN